MTHQEFADAVGVSRGAVQQWERGLTAPTRKRQPAVADELHRALVSPPAKAKAPRSGASRLHAELRALFRNSHMLGKTPADIGAHLVVPHYPIDADVGLYAEFALRNGKLRVTETVDFRGTDHAGKKREAESKTLVLLQALEVVGRSDLHRSVVVSGASAKTQTSINLLSRYADDLIVRESAQDWARYIDMMAKAARLPTQGAH